MEKNEKTLFGKRVPACAKVKSVKSCRKFGVVAITMDLNGNAVTFFRTDFLPDVKRIAWDENEFPILGKEFHEKIPENVTETIKSTGGIFIARDFLMTPSGGFADNMNYEEAKTLAASLEVPEMEACLIYGVVYDTLGRWLIATGSLTKEEWVNSPDSKEEQAAILDRICGESGSEWTIRELFGDIFEIEWTQEKYKQSGVTRQGLPFSDGEANYPARKRYMYPTWLSIDAFARTMWSFINW